MIRQTYIIQRPILRSALWFKQETKNIYVTTIYNGLEFLYRKRLFLNSAKRGEVEAHALETNYNTTLLYKNPSKLLNKANFMPLDCFDFCAHELLSILEGNSASIPSMLWQ